MVEHMKLYLLLLLLLAIFLYGCTSTPQQQASPSPATSEKASPSPNPISACEKLNKTEADNCIFKIAEASKDETLCERIQTDYLKPYCIYTVATLRDDFIMCFEVNDSTFRETCFLKVDKLKVEPSSCERLKAINKDVCYQGLAGYQKNPSLCEKVANTRVKDACYMILAAFSMKDAALCEKINGTTDKQSCLAFFSPQTYNSSFGRRSISECGGFGVFTCIDQAVAPNSTVIVLGNAAGRQIELKSAAISGSGAPTSCTADDSRGAGSPIISPNGKFYIECGKISLKSQESYDWSIAISYGDPVSGLQHTDSGGFIRGKVG